MIYSLMRNKIVLDMGWCNTVVNLFEYMVACFQFFVACEPLDSIGTNHDDILDGAPGEGKGKKPCHHKPVEP